MSRDKNGGDVLLEIKSQRTDTPRTGKAGLYMSDAARFHGSVDS